jgi:hypothetical protein
MISDVFEIKFLRKFVKWVLITIFFVVELPYEELH